MIGDGAAAEDRVRRLTAAGAEVVVLPAAAYRAELLDAGFMVFVCDASVADEVSRDGRERGLLVYVLDQPDLSDLAMPALARRGPLQIAISTDGNAPALARRLREQIERLLEEGGPALDALLDEMSRRRVAGQRADLYEIARRLEIEGRLSIV